MKLEPWNSNAHVRNEKRDNQDIHKFCHFSMKRIYNFFCFFVGSVNSRYLMRNWIHSRMWLSSFTSTLERSETKFLLEHDIFAKICWPNFTPIFKIDVTLSMKFETHRYLSLKIFARIISLLSNFNKNFSCSNVF